MHTALARIWLKKVLKEVGQQVVLCSDECLFRPSVEGDTKLKYSHAHDYNSTFMLRSDLGSPNNGPRCYVHCHDALSINT